MDKEILEKIRKVNANSTLTDEEKGLREEIFCLNLKEKRLVLQKKMMF